MLGLPLLLEGDPLHSLAVDLATEQVGRGPDRAKTTPRKNIVVTTKPDAIETTCSSQPSP